MSTTYETYYHNILCEDIILKDNISNVHQVPLISSVTLSHSSSLITKNSQYTIPVLSGLELISGQKAKITKTKRSISGFQTRKNQSIGCKLTLRNQKQFAFLEKLVLMILPRLNKLEYTKGERSNYQFGIQQIPLFPEIEGYYDFFDSLKGIHLHITTSANSPISPNPEDHMSIKIFKLVFFP